MAYTYSGSSGSICSSPSSLYQLPPPPPPPSSPYINSWDPTRTRPRNSTTTALTSCVDPRLSLIPPTTTTHQPTPTTTKSSKSYIWVNAKSPKAPLLWTKSYDARYASLVQLARSLDSSPPDQIPQLLSDLTDQDAAVLVLNNMSNPAAALLALSHFLHTPSHFPSGTREVVVLYNVTLKVLRKSKDLERAEKLFDEMLQRGVPPDNVTFSTLISCARFCNLPHRAVEWFEKMPGFGLDPDGVILSTMIDAYGRVGNIEMALSLYDRARTEKWRLDAVTFSTLIKLYGLAGNYDGCLNVYEEMKALGAKPNLVTYNTLLDAMGRAKRPWQAKAIYKEMVANEFLPSFATYAALLRAYGRARYGDDALEVYREMKDKGMVLNVILYNTLLAMCADLGFVDEAVEIFEDMKRATVVPDSWTFSSLITVYSCSGKVVEAENILSEMLEAGIRPNIFILTSLIQCYGKAQLTEGVVRTFNRFLELGITPDDRFCGCLLNVMTQTSREQLVDIIKCIERVNSKLGYVVKLLVDGQGGEVDFKKEAAELLTSVSVEVKKAYCNCLIDLCVNLNMLERACELLDLGLRLEIYRELESRSATQWSLHLKSLSLGAALTALHVWINDLSRAVEFGEVLPPLLGINTGHGKHKYSDKGLASAFESHLKELNAPFHEASDKVGWFLTTKVAAELWLESRKSTEVVAA